MLSILNVFFKPRTANISQNHRHKDAWNYTSIVKSTSIIFNQNTFYYYFRKFAKIAGQVFSRLG